MAKKQTSRSGNNVQDAARQQVKETKKLLERLVSFNPYRQQMLENDWEAIAQHINARRYTTARSLATKLVVIYQSYVAEDRCYEFHSQLEGLVERYCRVALYVDANRSVIEELQVLADRKEWRKAAILCRYVDQVIQETVIDADSLDPDLINALQGDEAFRPWLS